MPKKGLELLIVLAIVGIFSAAVALPAYQDYITTTQSVLRLQELGGLKQEQILAMSQTGNCISRQAQGSTPSNGWSGLRVLDTYQMDTSIGEAVINVAASCMY